MGPADITRTWPLPANRRCRRRIFSGRSRQFHHSLGDHSFRRTLPASRAFAGWRRGGSNVPPSRGSLAAHPSTTRTPDLDRFVPDRSLGGHNHKAMRRRQRCAQAMLGLSVPATMTVGGVNGQGGNFMTNSFALARHKFSCGLPKQLALCLRSGFRSRAGAKG